MQFRLVAQLRGFIRHDTDAHVHVSYCPALNIFSQGESEDQARRAIGSAVSLFLQSCYERGQLDRALREAGFRASSRTGIVPVKSLGLDQEWIAVEERYEEVFDFDVPLHLIASQHSQNVGAV